MLVDRDEMNTSFHNNKIDSVVRQKSIIAASGFVVGGGRTLRLGGARKARPLGPSSLRSRFDSSAAADDGGDDKDTLRGAVVGTSARGARHFR